MHLYLASTYLPILAGSNLVAYLLGGGSIQIRIGRISIRVRRPERRD
jgi:hypothetical protein